MMMQESYPQTVEEWRKATEQDLGWKSAEIQDTYEAGTFPFPEFEGWLRSRFRQGYSPDFLPALLRNVRGLVAWMYSNAEEPYWPGSDGDGEIANG